MKEDRPTIKTINFSIEMSAEEDFQNNIIRPIIKMKHELILVHFKNYLIGRKIQFSDLKEEAKLDYIKNSIKRDASLKSELNGFIIGHFTLEEYNLYTTLQSKLNRRISNIIIERLSTHLEILSQ